MTDFVVPLSDVRFSAEEVEAVAGVYRSGWLSQGPRVAAFERAFAEFVGSRHAVAVANGTAALHLAFAAAGLGAGDEVVLPAMTFAATAAAVIQTGATPVFADIDSDALPWLSVAAARAAIGPRTAAIVNVAYAGHGGEVLALQELARASGLFLIEDAAHAPGAVVDGHRVGTIGRAGTFSFYANKNLPLGEGGMLVTDDDELAGRARLLRSHGLSSDTWARHRNDAASYEVVEPGYNYRLDEPRASLGLLLLARLQRDNERRAELAAAYATALDGVDGIMPVVQQPPSATSAWHIYPLLLDEGIDRVQFRSRLRAVGIQTSVHYPPLHLTRAFALPGGPALPATESYARRTVSVPLFPHMTKSQQLLVITSISASLRGLTHVT
jgi:dTDP-4-amino-4,6-dideoxygalactose transaminase